MIKLALGTQTFFTRNESSYTMPLMALVWIQSYT